MNGIIIDFFDNLKLLPFLSEFSINLTNSLSTTTLLECFSKIIYFIKDNKQIKFVDFKASNKKSQYINVKM